ncbi:hypothetical protein CRYUN_Cryun40dG0005000 [Craigia yunnanensis]
MKTSISSAPIFFLHALLLLTISLPSIQCDDLINQTSDPQMERALAYCAELHIPAIKYNLPQAIDASSKVQLAFASDGISDAAKEADACEKNFSGSMKSPLSDRNKLLHSLSDVAVAIVKLSLKG